MVSTNKQQMAQSLHQNGLTQEQAQEHREEQEQAQYDKELKQAFKDYDNGLEDVDRLDNSLYLAQSMPNHEDDSEYDSEYYSSSDSEPILYEPFYHFPVRQSSLKMTKSLGFKTMDSVEDYWMEVTERRKQAATKWEAACAHRQAQVDVRFMADLPKFSAITRERLATKDKLIKDEAAAHLKTLRVQAEIDRKKPREQMHRGGRRGKGPAVLVNKVADAKAEKVLEERRAKKRIEKKELKKLQDSKTSSTLPSGWTIHKNESHVIYISPSGKTQLQHPLSVSRVVIQAVVPEPKVVSDERAAEIVEEEEQQNKAIAMVCERFENEEIEEAAEAIRVKRESEELDYDFSVFLKNANNEKKVVAVVAVAPKAKNVIVLGAQSYRERPNDAPHVTREGMCTNRLCYSIPKGTGCPRADNCRCAHTEGELDKEGIKCIYGARCGCIGASLRPGRKECYFWHPDLESWTQYLSRTKLAKPEPVKEVVVPVFDFPELPVAPKPVIRQVVQASSWACAAGGETEEVTEVEPKTVIAVSKIDKKPIVLPTVVIKSSWAAVVRGFEIECEFKPEPERPKIRSRRSWWDVKVMPAGHWTEHLATQIVEQSVEKKSCVAPITNPWNKPVIITKSLPPADQAKIGSVEIWHKVEKKGSTTRSGRKTGWDVQRNYRKTRWDSEGPVLVNTNTVRMTEEYGATQFSQAMAEGKMNFRMQVV
jgi:hypothetical protein